MSYILLILIFIAANVVIFGFVLFYIFNIFGFFTGGSYAGTPYEIVDCLFEFVKIDKKDIVYDLGSGDGRVLIAAAENGANAVGWEINYPLYVYSVRRIKRLNLQNKIKIHYGNFWKTDISSATVIFAFLMPKYMVRLERKLKKEASSGTLVVTYKAKLPSREPIKISADGLAVYYF